VWFGKETAMSEANAFSAIPTKILVPIDFSSSSHAALDAATELAERFHAELYLLNIIPAFPVVSLPDSITEASIIEHAKKAAGERFATSEAALTERAIKVTSSVEVGEDVAGSILDVIEREHIDLVVISTHGLSGWYPLVFGSIAEKLVKLVQCPLMLLHSSKPESSAKKVGFGRSMEWW
jgi:nucleotide-binding universal stress UspA family protein